MMVQRRREQHDVVCWIGRMNQLGGSRVVISLPQPRASDVICCVIAHALR
jgi:hypothetical protein